MNTLTHSPRRQRGAALVVGMILLLVLTLLAISGMNTSTLELQMAGNAQYGQNAFQAAETGIQRLMWGQGGNFNTNADTPLDVPADHFNAVMRHNKLNGITEVPEGGYSMGVGIGFKAAHFDITSNGSSDRGATSTQVQSFYVKVPT